MSEHTDYIQTAIEALRDDGGNVPPMGNILADNIDGIVANVKKYTDEGDDEIPSLKFLCDKMPEKERLAGRCAAIQLWFAVSSQIYLRDGNQFNSTILVDVDTTRKQRKITITNLETDYSKLVTSKVWGMNGYLGHASVPEWVDGFESTLRTIGFSDWYFTVEGDEDHPIVRTITLSLPDDNSISYYKPQPRKMFKEEWFRDPSKRFVRANRAPTTRTM